MNAARGTGGDGADPARDPRLLAALAHAPDADAEPPPALDARIAAAARGALGPRAAAPVPWWQRWAQALQRPPAAAAFASLALASVIGVMWRGEVPPEALPTPPTPAAQQVPAAPPAAPQPASPTPAPTPPPAGSPDAAAVSTPTSARPQQQPTPAERRAAPAAPPAAPPPRLAAAPPPRERAASPAVAETAGAAGPAAAPPPPPAVAAAPSPAPVATAAPPSPPAAPPVAAPELAADPVRRAEAPPLPGAAAQRSAAVGKAMADRSRDVQRLPRPADAALAAAVELAETAARGRWSAADAAAAPPGGVVLRDAQQRPLGRLLLDGDTLWWLPADGSPAQRAPLDPAAAQALRAQLPPPPAR